MEMCPCGSGNSYEDCCRPIMEGTVVAETAEALLRSRFAAHVKSDVNYILETTHSSKREENDEKSISRWTKNTEWKKLEIIETKDGGPDDEKGTVEFKADYREKGEKRMHHEIASFVKTDGKWYFHDAEFPTPVQVVRQGPKVGRNEPCPCGSGKKYKKCCGR